MKLSEGRVKAAKEIHERLEECLSVSRLADNGIFYHPMKERDIKNTVKLLNKTLFALVDLFEDLEYSLETGHKVFWSEAQEELEKHRSDVDTKKAPEMAENSGGGGYKMSLSPLYRSSPPSSSGGFSVFRTFGEYRATCTALHLGGTWFSSSLMPITAGTSKHREQSASASEELPVASEKLVAEKMRLYRLRTYEKNREELRDPPEELNLCPFCGGPAVMIKCYVGYGKPGICVKCIICNSSSSKMMYDCGKWSDSARTFLPYSEAEAVTDACRRWNRRTAPRVIYYQPNNSGNIVNTGDINGNGNAKCVVADACIGGNNSGAQTVSSEYGGGQSHAGRCKRP